MTRRLLTASAAAALVLGLAACGDDTGGTITDPPSTIATGASDGGGTSDGGGAGGSTGGASDDGGNTEAAPDIPAPVPADYPGMDEHTDEGAEQAFKYFLAATVYGFQTGEVELITRLSGPECVGCNSALDSIEYYNENKTFWSPTEITEYSIDSEAHGDGYEYTVTYEGQLTRHSELNPESNSVVNLGDQNYVFGGGMNWIDGEWQTSGFSIETAE